MGKVSALTEGEGLPRGIALNFESDVNQSPKETVNVACRGLVPSSKAPNVLEGVGHLEATLDGVLSASDHDAAFTVTIGTADPKQIEHVTVEGKMNQGERAFLDATGTPDVDGKGSALAGTFTVGQGNQARGASKA